MIWFKPGLSKEELKKEYKNLAKQYHPDISKDPNAEEKFKEINNQFDDYFVKQAEFEYGWATEAAAREKAHKVRATLLVYLLRDQYNPGKFFTFVERQHYTSWSWFWWSGISYDFSQLKALTTDAEEWDGFRGGFAYCSYGEPDENSRVYLTKLPATIEPATIEELYFYNKATWGDQRWTMYRQFECRFGTIWTRYYGTRNDGYENVVAYMKTTLPKEFLEIGEADEKNAAMYEARQIKEVVFSTGYIREGKILQTISGEDIPYAIFQDCTAEEFREYHDVDSYPQFADVIPATELGGNMDRFIPYFENPVVALAFSKGAIRIFQAKNNFRMRYGFFDKRRLEGNLHLFSIDEIEEIQDYLDDINKEFDTWVRGQIKKGKIKFKV